MKRLALVTLYLLSIVAGVVAVAFFGVVPIAPGIMAPAAVYVVGVTLVLRDLVHLHAGPKVAFFAVLGGAALSAIVSPALALASGLAFLIGETLDLLIFEKIENRFGSVPLAMLGSNAVSLVLDSLIFLWLAFGSYEFLPGQIIGKAVASVLAVAVLAAIGATRQEARA